MGQHSVESQTQNPSMARRVNTVPEGVNSDSQPFVEENFAFTPTVHAQSDNVKSPPFLRAFAALATANLSVRAIAPQPHVRQTSNHCQKRQFLVLACRA